MIPKGYPYWARVAGIPQYDGAVNKANYNGIGIINPNTDVSAEGFSRLVSDVANMANMAPYCRIVFQDAFPAAPLVTYCRVGSGAVSTGYSGDVPPIDMPYVTQLADRSFKILFNSFATDHYGVDAALDLRFCTVRAQHSTTPFTVPVDCQYNRISEVEFNIWPGQIPAVAGTPVFPVTVTAVFA